MTKKISGGKIVPSDYDDGEYWSWKGRKGRLPWFIRYARQGVFWNHKQPRQDGKDAESMEEELNRVPHPSASKQEPAESVVMKNL
jgi:hypothetical protein